VLPSRCSARRSLMSFLLIFLLTSAPFLALLPYAGWDAEGAFGLVSDEYYLRPSPLHSQDHDVLQPCQRQSMPHPTICGDATSAANVPSVLINMICTLSSAPFLRLSRAVCAEVGCRVSCSACVASQIEDFSKPKHAPLRSCVPFSFLLLLDRCHFQQVLYDRFCALGRGVSAG
jgi:hypothetical protein